MFDIVRKEIEWAGRPLIMETGKIARQADGAVMVTYGETKVLCTVVSAKSPKPDIDFFPLTVNYIEKTYAAGKIPGGFFKREGRPSEKETLVSRLIDRPIRPLFHDDFRNETQVVCTVMQHDGINDPDIVAMVGASAALAIAGVPFFGPIAGARVGYADGEYVLNPTNDQLVEGLELDLVVAGTATSVLMVESEADQLPEEVMLGAVMYGHREFQKVIDMIIELAEEGAKDPWDVPAPLYDKALYSKAKDMAETALRDAYKERAKQARVEKISAAKQPVKEVFSSEGFSDLAIADVLKKLEKDIVRGELLKSGTRIDGRDTKTVRPILAEVGILPRTHGSALFTRGETQALVVATLGNTQDEQIIDALQGEYRDNFMLHYNFPPYSVGESYMMRPPGRREIGHGRLARRSLEAVLPTKEEFPYTIRVVSEITESNGSSSMASVCGASLALMDAGVPVKSPVAGIAMGLIKENDDFVVLSDIMGDEDHLGDMDFKVAGTAKGVTALQMDIKINGITEEIMKIALSQAKEGRNHILGEMNKAMTAPRDEVNEFAPKISTIEVPKDKIREIIGTGGSVIRELCEVTNTKIDIDDSGMVNIFAQNASDANDALQRIKAIVAEAEIGEIYTGKVNSIVDFGAFVNFLGAKDGLVHISELSSERVNAVTDVVKEGDEVKVKVIGMDRGKVRLSMRAVDQTTGEDISEGMEFSQPKSGGERRPRRDGDKDRKRA